MVVDGRVAPVADAPGSASARRSRILDATLVCVARWGVNKTTLDDVAREAGCSRATVYRLVDGGKDGLMLAAADRELERFFWHLRDRVGSETTVVGRVALAIAESVRVIAGHHALQQLVVHEPEVVLPFISFDALDPLLEASAAFGAIVLATFLEPDDARAVGEWVARVVVSYGFEPDPRLDLGDMRTADRFVRRYLPHLITAGPPSSIAADDRRNDKETTHVHH